MSQFMMSSSINGIRSWTRFTPFRYITFSARTRAREVVRIFSSTMAAPVHSLHGALRIKAESNLKWNPALGEILTLIFDQRCVKRPPSTVCKDLSLWIHHVHRAKREFRPPESRSSSVQSKM